MKQIINKVSSKHIFIFFTILILFFSLRYISQLSIPTFLNDELGYLANAAFLAGKNWSGVTRISAYYSYGYSLIIAPLFLILKNTELLYKTIILFNICFYIISYYISFKTIKDLFKKVDTKIIAFVCGVVALYGANIYNVNYAWVEPITYLIFWLLIYQLNCIYKNAQIKNIFIFSFLLCYIYIIHQRTIGVVLVGILCMICMFKNKNIDKKKIILFFVYMFLFMIIGILIKKYIYVYLWNNTVSEKTATLNTYDGQIAKIIALIQSPTLIWNLIRGIIGKYYYLFISTGGLISFGVIQSLKRIKETYIVKKQIDVVFLFMILSLFAMIVISSLFFIRAERLDTLLYGRYNEFAMLPLFICGILAFIEKKFSIKDYVLNLALLFVCYIAVRGFLSGIRNYIFPCTVNASMFYIKLEHAFSFNKYMFTGIVLFTLVYLLITRKQLLLKCVAFLILISFWNASVSSAMDQDKLLAQNHISQLQSIVENITENKPIYYIYDGNYEDNYSRWFIGDIQFMMPNKTILLTTTKEVGNLKDCYIITYEQELEGIKYKEIHNKVNYRLYLAR